MVEKTPGGIFQEGPSQLELTFGDILRSMRKRQGLSSKDLAKRMGASPAAISQWELGRRNPRMPTLLLLLQILNPVGEERSKLSVLTGIPNIPDKSEDFILRLLEERLIKAERVSSQLTEEIGEIKSLLMALRLSRSTGNTTES